MTDCARAVEITAHAAVVDVTKEDEAARAAAAAGTDGGVAEADAAVEVAAAEAGDAALEGTAPPAGIGAAPAPELVAAGERVFRQCLSCHEVGEDARIRAGPSLDGIMGHPPGALEGFCYPGGLNEMAEDGPVRNEEDLSDFLTATGAARGCQSVVWLNLGRSRRSSPTGPGRVGVLD
jgi:cytochrome c